MKGQIVMGNDGPASANLWIDDVGLFDHVCFGLCRLDAGFELAQGVTDIGGSPCGTDEFALAGPCTTTSPCELM